MHFLRSIWASVFIIQKVRRSLSAAPKSHPHTVATHGESQRMCTDVTSRADVWNSFEGDKQLSSDDVLKYGQEFHLMANPELDAQPLFLHSQVHIRMIVI